MQQNELDKLLAMRSRLMDSDDMGQTARRHVLSLLDEDSFVEIDVFVEPLLSQHPSPFDGVVCGFGRVNGQPVYVFAQEGAVMGGSVGLRHAQKIIKTYKKAMEAGVPVIGLYHTLGIRLEEGMDALDGYAQILGMIAQASGVIPQVAVVLGQCVGMVTHALAMSDLIIAQQDARISLHGPQLALYHDDKLEADYGTATWQARSGLVQMVYPTKEQCLTAARNAIGYLPANNLSALPALPCNDDANRLIPELDSLEPNSDIRGVIQHIVDQDSFMELGASYAPAMVTALCRLDGSSVGVVANQPSVNEARIDRDAADKAARMVRLCNAMGIPIITMTDSVGFEVGQASEMAGMARSGARLTAAYAESTVPMVNVIVGRAIGAGYITMCSKALGADIVLAWPKAEISPLPSGASADILMREQLEGADDPMQTRKALVEQYRAENASAYQAAARGLIEDIIAPSQTRPYLIAMLQMLVGKRQLRMEKKHSNTPM